MSFILSLSCWDAHLHQLWPDKLLAAFAAGTCLGGDPNAIKAADVLTLPSHSSEGTRCASLKGSDHISKPSDLTRTLQEFADILRSLRPEHLAREERATMRAILVELHWLVDQTEPDK